MFIKAQHSTKFILRLIKRSRRNLMTLNLVTQPLSKFGSHFIPIYPCMIFAQLYQKVCVKELQTLV